MNKEEMTFSTLVENFFTGRGYVTPEAHAILGAIRTILLFACLAAITVIFDYLNGNSYGNLDMPAAIFDAVAYVVVGGIWRYMRQSNSPVEAIMQREFAVIEHKLDQDHVEHPPLPEERSEQE